MDRKLTPILFWLMYTTLSGSGYAFRKHSISELFPGPATPAMTPLPPQTGHAPFPLKVKYSSFILCARAKALRMSPATSM